MMIVSGAIDMDRMKTSPFEAVVDQKCDPFDGDYTW